MRSTRCLVRYAACLSLCIAGSVAHAWIDTGHMVVAAIAEKDLKPSVLAEAKRLLMVGGDEKSRDLLGAACWADDYKTAENGPWHYINHHFHLNGQPSANRPLDQNVVWAIERFSKVLANRSRPDAERSEALRFILHFVGDVHQPLHTSALDSQEHPKGDRGGNDFTFDAFPVAGFQVKNLHFLWDIAGGLYKGVMRPLEDRSAIDQLADRLTADHPRSAFPEATTNEPARWAMEGLKLCKEVVYGLQDGVRPSDAYLQTVKETSSRRLALAGYRLADLLNQALRP